MPFDDRTEVKSFEETNNYFTDYLNYPQLENECFRKFVIEETKSNLDWIEIDENTGMMTISLKKGGEKSFVVQIIVTTWTF